MSRAWLVVLGAAWWATEPGCFSPELTPGLPCATDREPPCPDGQVCDLAANTCVPDSALGTWRDDTAEDFADPAAVFEEATVEAAGFVGPMPYLVEAIAIAGVDDNLIGAGNEADVAWDDIVSAQPAGRGFRRRGFDLDFFAGEAAGTGLDDLTGVTIRLEGEIYLDAGATELQLSCEDRGFFDLGDPATGLFTRIVAAVQGPPDTGTATVSAAGWYPFHAAVEGDGGGIHFHLETDAGGGSFETVDADRLRTRVADLDGLALDGFDDPYLHDVMGSTLSTVDLGERQDYAQSGSPADLGDLGAGTWSVRWSGQVLVEAAGTYSFELDSRGGHRMWLDGVQVADTNDAEPAQTTTTPQVDLDAGWHDIVIDTMKDSDGSTPAHFQITVASGPDLVGEFFPPDHTRPVTGRGARWRAGGNSSVVAIPDAATATKTVFLGLPDDAVPSITDYAWSFTHPVQSTVSIALDRPGAPPVTLIAAGDLTGAGAYGDRLRFDDEPADGAWQLIGTDSTADVMTGSLTTVRITTTYAGGAAPFPTRARYTSRVRDLGPVVAYSGVRWQTRQAAPDAIAVSVRSCDDATCIGVPWTPVAASGDVAGIAPAPFAQYQVEITTDGDVAAALDWIEIDYRL